MPTQAQVGEILRNVFDPELMISIVDMGLVYGIGIQEGTVHIKMTLTAMGCPLWFNIQEDVERQVKQLKDVNEVKVELVFEPRWNPTMMSEDAQMMTGYNF